VSWVWRYEWKFWLDPFVNFLSQTWIHTFDLQWVFFFLGFFLPEGSWIPKDKWTVIIYSQPSKTMEFSFVSLTCAHIIIVIRKVLGFLTLWCWETWVGKWQRACFIDERPKTCLLDWWTAKNMCFLFLWVPKKCTWTHLHKRVIRIVRKTQH